MKIKAVTVNRFRSYSSPVTVQFDDLLVIVGRNDIGKSTNLEALDIFFNEGKGCVKIDKDDINKMVAYLRDNGGDWINLVLKEKREKTEGKPTHYLEVDTWKPNNESVSEKYHPSAPPPQAPPPSSDETGLPF